jgi:hypothetical protein
MGHDQDTTFQRTIMTGLFIGIIDTIICLGYNIGYREYTGYTPSALINVSSLIFAVNLSLLLAGMIYFLFVKVFGKNDLFFVIAAVFVTIFLIWKTEIGHRFADYAVNAEFKGLLLGIILIMGISAAIIPLLFRSKLFDKYIL